MFNINISDSVLMIYLKDKVIKECNTMLDSMNLNMKIEVSRLAESLNQKNDIRWDEIFLALNNINKSFSLNEGYFKNIEDKYLSTELFVDERWLPVVWCNEESNEKIEIYTDGSFVEEDKVGSFSIIYNPNKDDLLNLPTKENELQLEHLEKFKIISSILYFAESSYETELTAILKSISIAPLNKQLIIYTDSLSAIESIKAFDETRMNKNIIKYNYSYILLSIYHMINIRKNLKSETKFVHVKSHTNNKDKDSSGNRIADFVCKKLLDDELDANTILNYNLGTKENKNELYTCFPSNGVIPVLKIIDQDNIKTMHENIENYGKIFLGQYNSAMKKEIKLETYMKMNVRQVLKSKLIPTIKKNVTSRLFDDCNDKNISDQLMKSKCKTILNTIKYIEKDECKRKIKNKKIGFLLILIANKLDTFKYNQGNLVCMNCKSNQKADHNLLNKEIKGIKKKKKKIKMKSIKIPNNLKHIIQCDHNKLIIKKICDEIFELVKGFVKKSNDNNNNVPLEENKNVLIDLEIFYTKCKQDNEWNLLKFVKRFTRPCPKHGNSSDENDMGCQFNFSLVSGFITKEESKLTGIGCSEELEQLVIDINMVLFDHLFEIYNDNLLLLMENTDECNDEIN
jgi:hypothetical protein